MKGGRPDLRYQLDEDGNQRVPCARCSKLVAVEVTVAGLDADEVRVMVVCDYCLTARELWQVAVEACAALLDVAEDTISTVERLHQIHPAMAADPEVKARLALVRRTRRRLGRG